MVFRNTKNSDITTYRKNGRGQTWLVFLLFLFAGATVSAQTAINTTTQTEQYIQSGLAKTDNGDFLGAVRDFDAALKRSLASAQVYRYRGYAKLQLKDYTGTVQDCSEVLRFSVNDSNAALAYLYRAYAKFSLKQYEGATHDCTSALQLDPQDDEALSLRGMAKLQLNDYEGAKNDYSEALRVSRANAMYFFMRGQARAQMGDLVGAIVDFTMTLQLEPKAIQALIHRARVKIALQDPSACQDLKTAADTGALEALSMLASFCK
ncbi:MAG: tetratricopeptide repeat protein [Candidatus Kapaibacteriota bacterium]|jgi:tetratricopeptide (TPR) repeat protein